MHKLSVQSFSFISTAACLSSSPFSPLSSLLSVVVLAIVIGTIVTFNYVETATDEAEADLTRLYA